jgi:hypothetical protein
MLAIFALLYWAYFQFALPGLAATLLLDPLLFDGILIPAFFGFTLFYLLRGVALERAVFVVLMPVIPVLVLGQEGDPAKPGLQWIYFASIQLPYWIGAGCAAVAFWVVSRVKLKAGKHAAS